MKQGKPHQTKLHLPSVDTLSALFDRLIAEQVKRLHYLAEGRTDEVAAQQRMVESLTSRIRDLLQECLAEQGYDFLEEHRTFAAEALPLKLRDLTAHSLLLGTAEKEKLRLLLEKPGEDSSLFLLALIARLANEWRAASRKQIDETLRQLLS
jgi:hypothetical protein